MQSSTTVTIRALVMLVCLVSIPAMALFGASLPQWLDEFLEVRLGVRFASARQWDEVPSDPQSDQVCAGEETPCDWPGQLRAECPESRQPDTVSAGVGSPLDVASAIGRKYADDGARPANDPPGPRPRDARPATPAAFARGTGEAARAIDAAWPQQPGGVRAAVHSRPAERSPRPLVPVSHQQPGYDRTQAPASSSADRAEHAARPQADGSRYGRGAPPRANPPPGSSDAFTAIQNRLRELGATYYLLETWGDQGQLYRFYCKMALHGNPDFSRYFEATDADPLGAMRKVMAEVEAWSRGRF